MKRLALTLVILIAGIAAAMAQSVTVIGPVTPGNIPVFNSPTVIKDSGNPGGAAGFANPTTPIDLSTHNGSALTAMRSDAAPPLSQAIAPTWTGLHTFTATAGGITLSGSPNLPDTHLGASVNMAIDGNITAASATVPEGDASFNITSALGAANLNTAFKVGLSGSANCNSGSANCWAQSNVITLGAGGTQRGGIGYESDLNQFWVGNYTTTATPYAANFFASGQNTGGYGTAAFMAQFAANASPMWNYGVALGPSGFQVFNTASIFDESNSPTSLKLNGTHNTAVIDISGASTTGFLFKAIGFAIVSTGETIIGGAGVATGALDLSGVTNGTVKMQVQAVAGTYNFNLPTAAGTAGQPLLSGGGGTSAMTFGTLGVAGGGTGLATLTSNAIYKGNGTGNIVASSATDDGTTFAINGSGVFALTEANGNLTIQGVLTNALNVSTNEVRAGGDLGGNAGFVSYTGTASTTISTGTGTVKMSSVNSANSVGWIKIRNGTSIGWIPYWSTNSP